MVIPHLEASLVQAERRAVVAVLRSHPDWTLERLFEHTHRDAPRSALLLSLTLRELLADPAIAVAIPDDGGPVVDQGRLERAMRLTDESYDAIVLEVIVEADEPIAAAYLRARVGGPRWKLQKSLNRLIAAGEIRRAGVTSSTRYTLGGSR